MRMKEATPEERKRFYTEEWSAGDIPDFLLQTLHTREFGFDMDGTGPNNRYNQFRSVSELERYLKRWSPYSAYASVAMYERPSAREGWMRAELALDIDAKDLPIKTCGCPQGKVCERCIDDARKIAAEFAEILMEDLDLKNIYFVYSGRGFHIRIFDEKAMELEQSERAQIVEYVTGGIVPTDLAISLGYSRVFRERAARTLERLDSERLVEGGIKRNVAAKLTAEKEKSVEAIRSGKIGEISEIGRMGKKTLLRLLELLARINMECTDGKVTVDTKRILRLPSSLHSGVSRKCMVVGDLDRFRLDDAVPRFVREAST